MGSGSGGLFVLSFGLSAAAGIAVPGLWVIRVT